jgi:hypothetical protein
MATKSIKMEVSAGELIDKIAILEIKSERIGDAAKVENVRLELDLLASMRDEAFEPSLELAELARALKAVKERLWEIEDEIRGRERRKDFGARFVELARAVYHTNDERSKVKRRINELVGSELTEDEVLRALLTDWRANPHRRRRCHRYRYRCRRRTSTTGPTPPPTCRQAANPSATAISGTKTIHLIRVMVRLPPKGLAKPADAHQRLWRASRTRPRRRNRYGRTAPGSSPSEQVDRVLR